MDLPADDLRGEVAEIFIIQACQLQGFRAVWGHQPRAGIIHGASGFGVDRDQHPLRGAVRNLPKRLRGDHPFGVIRNDHRVKLAQPALREFLKQTGRQAVLRRHPLPIQSAELLLPAHDARLADGRMRFRAEGLLNRHALMSEDVPYPFSILILSDPSPELGLCAQRAQIERHVGRPSCHVAVTLHVHHGNRGLGRDPRCIAPQVVIQNHVSNDQYPSLANLLQELFQLTHAGTILLNAHDSTPIPTLGVSPFARGPPPASPRSLAFSPSVGVSPMVFCATVMKRKPIRNSWLWWLASDVLALVLAYYSALFLRFHETLGPQLFGFINRLLGVREGGEIGDALLRFYRVAAPRILAQMGVLLIVLYALQNLYEGHRFLRKRPVGWHVLLANAGFLLTSFLYLYLTRNTYHPRSFFITVTVLNVVFCLACRSALESLLRFLRRRQVITSPRAILIGDTHEAYQISGLIEGLRPHGMQVVAHLTESIGQGSEQFEANLRALVDEKEADLVIVADSGLSVAEIMTFLDLTATLDLTAKILTGKLGVLQSEAGLACDTIHGIPLVHFDPPSVSTKDSWPRRMLSMTMAGVMTLLVAPLLGMIALLVKLEDDGPVFFVQERVGVNRKPFRMIKFRTMHRNAEQRLAELEVLNESGDGLFKIRNDPRVTRVGRILRRYSLDELPQLFNVVKGDMRVVGPRPLPRRDFKNYYEEWHYTRHCGMPGLTCLWQISGRSDIDFHNMCILDVYYLRNQNWVLDLKIVLKTLWVILFARGAY